LTESSYIFKNRLDALEPFFATSVPVHPEHGLKEQMLLDLERADKQVILLDVATQ